MQMELSIQREAGLWSDFESEVVAGRYPLSRLVRSEGRCGWFETKFDEKPAIVSLFESLNDESMLLARLRAAEKVKDKNVAAIFEAGTANLRNTPLVYAVMEHTEENLEDVLRMRALSAEETKEVTQSLVNALRAIHKERLVCGRLEAAGVLAAGDTIKLRSDYLQLIPPDSALELQAAKDVHDLGNLVHQCLTQRPLKQGADANDPSLQLLPAPFVQIVRRTLSGRAALDEIAALLQPGIPAPQPVVPSPAPKTSAAISPAKFEPAEKKEPSKAAEIFPPQPGVARKSTPWIVGGFIVLLLVAVFVIRAVVHHSDRAQVAKNPVVVVSPETTPRRAPAVSTPSAAAVPKATPPPPATRSSGASPAGAWRVVAFTYNHQDQAEHKAQTINEKHPDLKAGVFSPKGGAPYLVTLGDATDKTSAFRLREKAVAEGLPKDTYAQNYTH
jgi:hypothetical protein